MFAKTATVPFNPNKLTVIIIGHTKNIVHNISTKLLFYSGISIQHFILTATSLEANTIEKKTQKHAPVHEYKHKLIYDRNINKIILKRSYEA